jgi:predicted HD phosphohydrolase
MTTLEALEFEQDELFQQYLAIRRWDDKAKEQNKPLPSLEDYRQLMIEHLSLQTL